MQKVEQTRTYYSTKSVVDRAKIITYNGESIRTSWWLRTCDVDVITWQIFVCDEEGQNN